MPFEDFREVWPLILVCECLPANVPETHIASGGWIRGDKADYDQWSQQVQDARWSYDGLLPYFRRSEHFHKADADPSQHGFDGPMHTSTPSSSGRKYPLRDASFRMWLQAGFQGISDANAGYPQGIAELVDNRRDGLRQLTSDVYRLDGVTAMTGTIVKRVILEQIDGHQRAVAVELEDGSQIKLATNGEIIASAGAYRTPQRLMLSGIGDPEVLSQHKIQTIVDLPDVGQHLHDHLMCFRYWSLRHPEQGLAMGSPALTDPSFMKGNPVDWIVTSTIPETKLDIAMKHDAANPVKNSTTWPNSKSASRSHLELLMFYGAFAGEQIGLEIPLDGKSVMTYCMGCLPTSRGYVTIRSDNPSDAPVIDPNYYATEVDRMVMREGWRTMSKAILETSAGQELVKGEILPTGHSELRSDAADDSIDARIKIGAMTTYHPAGTASMGKVVDGSLNVNGVKGLRVADASVIPVPLAAHYQAAIFAIAEQAVDIILGDR